MKTTIIAIVLLLLNATFTMAQNKDYIKEITQLSKDKWEWMADKNIEKLKTLFHGNAKFVHMSGTWDTERELEIIETGSIWYKKATIYDTAVEVSENTVVVWNRITLESVVRGNDAKVEFTVTEVYQKMEENWKMLAMTFSSVRDTHEIEK